MIDFNAGESHFTAESPRSPRKAFGLVEYGGGDHSLVVGGGHAGRECQLHMFGGATAWKGYWLAGLRVRLGRLFCLLSNPRLSLVECRLFGWCGDAPRAGQRF